MQANGSAIALSALYNGERRDICLPRVKRGPVDRVLTLFCNLMLFSLSSEVNAAYL